MKKNLTINPKKEKRQPIKYFLKNTFWAVKFIGSIKPTFFIFSTIISVFFQISPILNSYLYSRVFLTVSEMIFINTNIQDIFQKLLPTFSLLIGLNLLVSILSFVNNYISKVFNYTRDSAIQKRFTQKYASLDIQLHDSKSIADTIKKAEDNIWKIDDIVNDIVDYFSKIIGGITSIFIIGRYLPYLIPFVFIINLPLVVKDILYNKEMRKIYDEVTEPWRMFWTGKWYLTNKSSLKELKITKGDKRLLNFIFNLREKLTNKWINLFKRYRVADFFGYISNVFDGIGFFTIAANEILKKGNVGNVSFYYDQFGRVIRFFSVLFRDIVYLYDKMKYVEYLKNFFEIESVIKNGTKILKLDTPPDIEFINVSFKYPNTNVYVLRNINLKISSNSEIALVGENGAGKSTLIKLILRFYDVIEGKILINGIDIKELELESYYEHIGTLFQDYYYPGFYDIKKIIKMMRTRFSNISYKKAAKEADVDDDIMKLPHKYKTNSSTYFENGTELSQGQSQKLVLARMFYRNSPILILDEPTASIDPVSEYNIFKRIYKFMTDKTVIIISHRFSTVRNAQKIYVLDNGRIVEQGSHKELMALNGKYANAFNKQAEGYTKED